MPRTADLDRALVLLRELAHDGKPVFFSGKSLDIVFEHLRKDLAKVKLGREDQLLEYWKDELLAFRKQLIVRAESVYLPDRGETVLLVTEKVATEVTDKCPPPPDFP